MGNLENYQIIFFDGECIFCNKSISFLIKFDKKKIFKFASLQSETGQNILKKFQKDSMVFDSIILYDGFEIFEKSDAFIKICIHLSGGWKFFSIVKFLPYSVRDFFYDFIANNRYIFFGKSNSCIIPSKEERERFI
jgi:predicted DCC family thiol-disulfide oxidoreductase YuxK